MLFLVCFSYSEWSAIEKEMGDGLQSAGHHMDVWVLTEYLIVWCKPDVELCFFPLFSLNPKVHNE